MPFWQQYTEWIRTKQDQTGETSGSPRRYSKGERNGGTQLGVKQTALDELVTRVSSQG